MDTITDTPMKRRKTETGHITPSLSYDSQDDSGDNLFDNYETIATIPLPRRFGQETPILSSSPVRHVTQPTQIIEQTPTRVTHTGHEKSIVQVAASSPVKTTSTTSPISTKLGGRLAYTMAPPGTTFRQPLGVRKSLEKTKVIDISDDEGIKYQGGSSDDDSQRSRRINIKPSTFIQRAQKMQAAARLNSTPKSNDSSLFKEITSRSYYEPLEAGKMGKTGSDFSGSVYDPRNRNQNNTTSKISVHKRSADHMNDSKRSPSRPVKQVRQTGPARAQPPVRYVTLDDVEDYQIRQKISRMQIVLPNKPVQSLFDGLRARGMNENDALEYLSAQDQQILDVVEISDSESGLRGSPSRPQEVQAKQPAKPTAKQQLKAANRTIQEKYTVQPAVRKVQAPISSPRSSVPLQRRRLVQGRKKRLSSPISSPPKDHTPPPRHSKPKFDDDSDSGIGSDPEEIMELDGKLLGFFNSCSAADLADIAAVNEEVALRVIAKRPFKKLDEVRKLSTDVPQAQSVKRKSTKRPYGEKIVDTCQTMWTGYEAIDQLVKRCEALGKPLADEMQKWGVDVYGSSKSGELEIVEIDHVETGDKADQQLRDSGIGTPTSSTVSGDEEAVVDTQDSLLTRRKTRNSNFFAQPSSMGEGVLLKNYQIVGINWLSLIFDKELSCILADDMGLGKTCQVIAFLAHLLEKGIKGPHLVIVPGSTLENWLREFQQFCPTLRVMPYYASQKERPDIQEDILENLDTINVVVTTYPMAKTKDDNKFLRRLKPCVCVFDEGHYLKSSTSIVYGQLMKIPARFRLLLTGTPLQNNLSELASLLGFILPTVFNEHRDNLQAIFSHKAKTTEDKHSALLSAQRIARARSMMTPFVLRRKKHQVLKHLPTKTRRVEICELSDSQRELYTNLQQRVKRVTEDRQAGKKVGNESLHVMMDLRKASIHPLLFRRLYDDTILWKIANCYMREDDDVDRNIDLVYDDLAVMTDYELHNFCLQTDSRSKYALQDQPWMDSGKVQKLSELLIQYKANGDRVLVFSQFVLVMNILEFVLETLGMKFFRLDGSTNINERQAMIDEFYEQEDITVFMLSTKAGGAGINLACANKVVIFDSSFNPQEDVQAENRAHRVGQTRDVEVVRLVTAGTIEEQIYKLGESKLKLDRSVAGEVVADEGGVEVDKGGKAEEKMGAKVVEEMIFGSGSGGGEEEGGKGEEKVCQG